MKKFIYVSLGILTTINLFFLFGDYHISNVIGLIVVCIVFIQVYFFSEGNKKQL